MVKASVFTTLCYCLKLDQREEGKMKHTITSTIALVLISTHISFAAPFIDNPKQFKVNNPDGNKYNFVKNYLNSLSHLKENAKRKKSAASVDFADFIDPDRIILASDNLVLDNVNLRVARNFLQKHKENENKLILKVIDMFVISCDEQIDQNNEERKILENLYKALAREKFDELEAEALKDKLKDIEVRRKESYKTLLETAMLTTKVLVSSNPNRRGRFVRLGVTEEERDKLLFKLDNFYEEQYQGEVREGQTFLEASISVLREALEDPTLGVIK